MSFFSPKSESNKLRLQMTLTFGGRVAALLCSFVNVVLTARFWGADGRGAVAVFMANVGVVMFACKVCTGGAASYHFHRVGFERLSACAYVWCMALAVVMGAVMACLGDAHPVLYVGATFLVSMSNYYLSVQLARKDILNYNITMLMQPLLTTVFVALTGGVLGLGHVAYFYSLLAGNVLILVYNLVTQRDTIVARLPGSLLIDRKALGRIVSFGWREETANVMQFLSDRMSYYVLGYCCGVAQVGVFSIAVALTESVMAVSKSISAVQYSEVINNGDTRSGWVSNRRSIVWAALFSAAGVAALAVMPDAVFVFVFGKSFGGLQHIIAILGPGVVVASATLVADTYFSAIGLLDRLILKSGVAFAVAAVAAVAIVPGFGIEGAAVANMLSDVAAVAVIMTSFARHGRALRGR